MPAFPLPENYAREGMSLRDWFAGQALQGLLAGAADADCTAADYARDAFMMADAMLAARKKDVEQ